MYDFKYDSITLYKLLLMRENCTYYFGDDIIKRFLKYE